MAERLNGRKVPINQHTLSYPKPTDSHAYFIRIFPALNSDWPINVWPINVSVSRSFCH